MSSLLVTRPEHDDTTHYLSNWIKISVDLAKSKGIRLFNLQKERANEKEVTSILTKENPLLCVFNGHGSESKIAGHKNEKIIDVDNANLLKGKITYAISCSSAKVLGPRCVDKGAISYIGYDDEFVFFYDPNMITHPINDRTAKLFLEPTVELVNSLIKGNDVDDSFNRSNRMFKDNIRRLLTSETSEENTALVRYLWWDMKHQVCLGDQKARF